MLLKMTQDIGKEITFIWVPSHVGIEGNELADDAAKNAARSNQHTINLISKIDTKAMLKL